MALRSLYQSLCQTIPRYLVGYLSSISHLLMCALRAARCACGEAEAARPRQEELLSGGTGRGPRRLASELLVCRDLEIFWVWRDLGGRSG